ncbi:MAG: AIM24 family protein [Deltaproteobacteria bacterium]|nr:AIM24 family protein [Deltaproteobacteria bacterium]
MYILQKQGELYSIEGGNFEILKIPVTHQVTPFAEAGKMAYIAGDVNFETHLPDNKGVVGGMLGKIVGAGKRLMAGESLFFTYFKGHGEVGFSGTVPGRIMPIGLNGGTVIAQRDAFIAAVGDVGISVAFQKRVGAILFGGEGFILEKISGSGIAFIQVAGDLLSFDLRAGETMRVDTGSAVAWDDSVTYSVEVISSVKSALFGGEGLFFTTLTGPGKVIVQTMTVSKLRQELCTPILKKLGK